MRWITGVAASVFAISGPTTAIADQLVVRLDSFSAPTAGDDSVTPHPRAMVPRGVPSTLNLPLATAPDGRVTVSLRQESLNERTQAGEAPAAVRVRVLSSAPGSVTEEADGRIAVGLDATLAIDDLATGSSRVFDLKFRGSADPGAAYDGNLPIYVEAWRRGEDGKPIENPTEENRSFSGVLSGYFER